MSWENHKVASNKRRNTGIKAGLAVFRANKARCWITFSAALANQLDFIDQKVCVQIGGEGDQGKIRIRAEETSPFSVRPCRILKDNMYYKLDIGHVSSFANRREKSIPVQWHGPDPKGWIEITLPNWAKNLPAPVKHTAPTTTAQDIAIDRQKSRSSQTARLLGDPTPGRSALDAK
jgi:hypothetical protein